LSRSAKTHCVTRPVTGQELFGQFDCAKHLRLGLTDADAADGISIEPVSIKARAHSSRSVASVPP
jgi:hypothetical protein